MSEPTSQPLPTRLTSLDAYRGFVMFLMMGEVFHFCRVSLLRDKKPDEALARMEEASALYVRVRGENHYDSANSFANLASIIESTGDREKAAQLWAKALAIHEQTLGATHPHTTLTRFNLGKNLFDQGNKAKAKELWTRCRDDWRATLGSDYSLVKSLDTILPTL